MMANGSEVSQQSFQKIRKLLSFQNVSGNSGQIIKWNENSQSKTFENNLQPTVQNKMPCAAKILYKEQNSTWLVRFFFYLLVNLPLLKESFLRKT